MRAVLDRTALTTLRTPAVSVAAVLGFLPKRALRVVVFGAGPQAISVLLRDDVVVIALGSHEPDARQLDTALLARATVIVEERDTRVGALEAIQIGGPRGAQLNCA